MELPFDSSKIYLRHILLFEFHKGSNVAEAVRAICQVYGEGTISEKAAQQMFGRFGRGIFDLKDIPYICDDIWLDCYRLLSPAKVGLALALVSDRFDVLTDTHFMSRKWALGHWGIERSENCDGMPQFNKYFGPKMPLPVPQKPLPNGIIGFQRIAIEFINSDVLSFLLRIRRLFPFFQFGFGNSLRLDQPQNWHLLISILRPLCGITNIIFNSKDIFGQLRTRFSPSFLRDCANLRSISADSALFLQFPPDDSAGASDGQALNKWLHTPLQNGRPKVLDCYKEEMSPWIDQLQTTFLNAITSVNFIIALFIPPFVVPVPFELKNWRTGERLKFWKVPGEGNLWWLIERGPNERNGHQWGNGSSKYITDNGMSSI